MRRTSFGRPRVGLLGKFALASVIPIALLGFVLAQHLKGRIEHRALDSATEAAVLSAGLGIQPLLTPADLQEGLSTERFQTVDRALRTGLLGEQVVRIKIWNREGRVVYSDDRQLVGRRFKPGHELQESLEGEVEAEITHLEEEEERNERYHGTLLEVYVPLRFDGGEEPAGVFEVYLPYSPIAAKIDSDTRSAYLLLFGGLALLYATLFRIVAGASRRLRRQAEENEHQALHDSLTGLPNRALFRDRVRQELAAARRRESRLAVMLIDLDRFKEVNDTLGHGSGDLLLRELGPRLRETLRETDTIARLGGDEFAVLLPDVADADAARMLAGRVRERLETPFEVDSLLLETEASIGIALYPEDGDDVDTLLRHADVAMYRAKETHEGVGLYATKDDHYSPGRLTLVSALRPALEERQLVVHYQPTARVDSGEVRQAEALVRWQHPERGLLQPVEFIPLAERTGLMRALTRYVLEEALRQCREWQDQGLDLGVSVNLSGRDLHDLDLPVEVAKLLVVQRVEPRLLELELTESTILTDPLRARGVLERLSQLGVRIAVDDFGSGYSSLAYLKRLPIDVLKIDKSFVLNMEADENDAVIVRSTIELGHNLGLEVVAEGVEREPVWRKLADLGCDVAQGYYLSRPIPASELAAWLRSRATPGRERAA